MKKIVIQNLYCTIDGQEILKNISFETTENEFVSIIGRSGSGKTTLLNCISGFIKYSGVIKKPNKMGLIFQKPGLFPWMTVEENIMFVLSKNHHEDQYLIDEYLKIAEILDKKYCYPHELSGGQLQRVAIVRSLIQRPSLLVMDEPFSGLDEKIKLKIKNSIINFCKKYKTSIVLVTHDIEEAIYMSDRILLIDNGVIKENLKIDRNKIINFISNEYLNEMKAYLFSQLFEIY